MTRKFCNAAIASFDEIDRVHLSILLMSARLPFRSDRAPTDIGFSIGCYEPDIPQARQAIFRWHITQHSTALLFNRFTACGCKM